MRVKNVNKQLTSQFSTSESTTEPREGKENKFIINNLDQNLKLSAN